MVHLRRWCALATGSSFDHTFPSGTAFDSGTSGAAFCAVQPLLCASFAAQCKDTGFTVLWIWSGARERLSVRAGSVLLPCHNALLSSGT